MTIEDLREGLDRKGIVLLDDDVESLWESMQVAGVSIPQILQLYDRKLTAEDLTAAMRTPEIEAAERAKRAAKSGDDLIAQPNPNRHQRRRLEAMRRRNRAQ